MSRTAAALALMALSPAVALAASRGRYGGALKVAAATQLPGGDPLLADAPAEAALLSLTVRRVCRLDRAQRVVPELALSIDGPAAGPLRVALLPGLHAGGGAPVAALEVAQSWARATQPATLSPYRALLFPLQGEGKALPSAATSQYILESAVAFPWPDLEKSLCHPALGVTTGSRGLSGVGPFLPTRTPGSFQMNLHAPQGRPYVDRLSVLATDERGATRAFAELHQADISLGAPVGGSGGPWLYATYLAFRSERVPASFRQSVESAIDRSDLTRFFVRGPAVALFQLLPPPMMPNDTVLQPPRPPVAHQELTLAYDSALPDQRLVAERIQVRLHDQGYRIQLKAVTRAELRAAWASGDFDAMLHAVLLPPVAGPALAVVIDLAGRHDLLAAELPAIGAVADAAQRDAKVRERAAALGPSLPLVPLYAQGLAVGASARTEGLSMDAFGLPQLDDVFLVP